MRFSNCSMFCVHSSLAIILMGKIELVVLLVCLSSASYDTCCVALPQGATGLSAISNCGIS